MGGCEWGNGDFSAPAGRGGAGLAVADAEVVGSGAGGVMVRGGSEHEPARRARSASEARLSVFMRSM